MLTQLEVYSAYSSAPDIPLALGNGSDADSIHIREITGLGPVKADVTTRALGSLDGVSFTGSRVGSRNIVLRIGFKPDWVVDTVSSLRQKVYAYFMPKQAVTFRFYRDDGPTVKINGYVETCEPDVFSKDPEMLISVICPQPDFVALDMSVVTGMALNVPVAVEFSNLGTVPSPAYFELKTAAAAAPYDGLVIIDARTLAPGSKLFQLVAAVSTGAYLRVDSKQGGKRAETFFPATSDTANLLSTLSDDSVWPLVQPGINKYRVSIASGVERPWTLSYFERFGGL